MMLPFSQALLSNFGWQIAYMALATCVAVVTIFSLGLRIPKGQRASTVDLANTITAKQALSTAFKDRNYLLLTTGFFVCGFHITLVGTHVPTYVIDRGLEVWTAAAILSLIGLFNVFGTLTFGYLSGKYSKKILLSILYFTRGIVLILFLILPTSTYVALGFGVLYGYLWLATIPPTNGVISQIFGTKYLLKFQQLLRTQKKIILSQHDLKSKNYFGPEFFGQ